MRQNLASNYEQLRRDAMRRLGGSLGLALFLRRGMTAWMQACSECADVETEPCSPSEGPETIPVEMRSQLGPAVQQLLEQRPTIITKADDLAV